MIPLRIICISAIVLLHKPSRTIIAKVANQTIPRMIPKAMAIDYAAGQVSFVVDARWRVLWPKAYISP